MGVPEDLAQFEQNLGQLIIKYEQYFLGMEKREPLALLSEVEYYVRLYANVSIVNTMYKFKYNSLVARFSSYKQYWNRILRLIEEGKYSRERFKLQMHEGRKTKEQAGARTITTARVDPEVEDVYRQYVEARRACNLPVGNLSPDLIAAAIAKQKPAIIDKHRCSKVEIRVVVEEGKPKIKVRPKK
jgi:hypothetical protein